MAQNDLDQPVFMDDNSTISPPPAKRSRLSSCQQLGFKGPLLQYLKKNANPKLLLKLMQCSKYFCYKEFPFMVIKDVKLENNNLFYHRLGKDNSYHKMVFHKISKPLWIVTPISIAPMRKLKLYYRLLSKAAVCDIDNIQLVNQTLYFEKFKRLILSKKIRIFIFQNSYFTNDKNGGCDSIDEILKLLPNVGIFEWAFYPQKMARINSETTKKLIENLNATTLKSLSLKKIPESFDFDAFAKFMDENPSISFALSFVTTVSTEYAETLQAYVDRLIETHDYESRHICIRFPGQTTESRKIICQCY